MDKTLEEQYFLHFALRRVHSLLGVYLAGFLLFHFFSNAFALVGPEHYNEKVAMLRSLPFLLFIEIGALAVPFLIHIVYGMVIIFQGSLNLGRNNYPRNWAYVAQRLTAVVVLAFLIYHVYTLRILHWSGKDENHFFEYLSASYFANRAVLAFYIVGIAATVFHLANGLCTVCMTWGVTIGPTSQRMMAGAATVIGLAYFVAAMGSLYGFTLAQHAAEVVVALVR